MESGAKGCEVVVSGKLRAARAKSQKFSDGVLIHSGQPAREFVDYAVRHVLLRQGVLGIKVKIFKPVGADAPGGNGKPLPDQITLVEPKPEREITVHSEHKMVQPAAAPAPAAEEAAPVEA